MPGAHIPTKNNKPTESTTAAASGAADAEARTTKKTRAELKPLLFLVGNGQLHVKW